MGVKTLYEYFYKLAYGDKGADKATLVNDCLDVADAEIKANKDAKHTQNTDTDLDSTFEAAFVKKTDTANVLSDITSAGADIEDAVTKKHAHSNKTELDKVTDGDHDVRTDDPHSVTKTQVGLANVENIKVKLDATSAPTVNNDVDEGYSVGSRWVDVTNDKEYVCLDATDGAAVWTETTSVGGGLDNVVEDTTPQLGGNLDTNDHGIAFPATQVPDAGVNVLDDYEEGNWTPALKFGGASVDMTYNVQAGLYTKIGRQVTITGIITLSAKGTSTGTATLIGLPFTSKNTAGASSAAALRFQNITFANAFHLYIGAASTVFAIREVTEAGSETNLDNSNFANNSTIQLNMTYFTD